MRTRCVYKVCEESEWAGNAILRGSADDRRDGFIHLSTAAQLPGTLARHFAGKRDLVLLSFEVDQLGDRLRWEPSRGGALFPHYYGELTLAQVGHVGRLPADAEGRPFVPESWRTDDGELAPRVEGVSDGGADQNA